MEIIIILAVAVFLYIAFRKLMRGIDCPYCKNHYYIPSSYTEFECPNCKQKSEVK